MKSVSLFPLRLAAYWLLFFAVFRLWFVLWFHKEWWPEQPSEVWRAFWHALPLDLSMVGYLLLLPLLLWHLGVLAGPRAHAFFDKAISAFNSVIVSVLVLVFGANVFIYEEWHTLLNHRAVEYLSTPRALLDSMSLGFKVASVALYAAALWAMWRLYRWVVGLRLYPERISRWYFLALPFWVGALALAIRGGLAVMPINESAVYYSVHPFHNHAATNTAWYLAHSQLETRSTVNRYRFMPQEEASARTDWFFQHGHPDAAADLGLLEPRPEGPRPNVVFLILESMTAQVVEELGGVPGVCPNLSRLIREGVLFEKIYGSGYRTDQGIVSVLGGYPAQPDQSIVLLSDKAEKIEGLPKILYGQGYATAFFYGGTLNFGNIGVWLRNQRVQRVLSENDFPSADKTQRWGVDDLRLLQRSLLEINQLKPPFCAAAMTLSLHPPFDVPYTSRWQQGEGEPAKFLHSAAFADHAVGEFFKAAEQQPWYANTIFVLVADHGASNPGQVGMDNPVSRHIPLIFFGQPLARGWRGKRVDTHGNHHDIPATVLHLLEGRSPGNRIAWSRDLWDLHALQAAYPNAQNQKLDFAYYTNENGLGWMTRQGAGFYHFGQQKWHWWRDSLPAEQQAQAQAYLQTLYEDFLRR
jgi:phosphoglycerol transferase MdoB-like AlkP superfamily enzyme